jgi:hypothetical protein
MNARRLSLLALSIALAAAPVVAHADPGQGFIQRRIAVMRANKAEALKTKQEALLIKRNPTLAAVRDLKKAEYKANNQILGNTLLQSTVPAAFFTVSHGMRGVPFAVALGAQILGMNVLARHQEANAYAHEHTMRYAADNGIALVPPGVELGKLDK